MGQFFPLLVLMAALASSFSETSIILKMKHDAEKISLPSYNRRSGAVTLFVLTAVAAYFLALRAEDTGSLQQYFLTFVLLVFLINRLARAIKG